MRALDHAILLYRRVGRFLKGKIEVKEPFHVEKAAVSRATVRLWLIRLKNDWPADEQKRKQAYRVEIEQAQAEDPDNAQVIIDVASLDRKLTEADAREAVRRAPGQYDGWFALGDLATVPAEKEQAFRKAVELEPDCAACNNSLAWFLVKNGRAKEALPYANRAVDLAPWASYIIDTLAEVALQLGRCTEAVQLQTRATRILINQGWKKEKREAHLASYRDQCAKK
jgi:predicted Zn-dependent protease